MTDDTSTPDAASDAASDAAAEMESTSGDLPSTEDDRVYLVPYGWWREAHVSGEGEGLRGTPYMVTPVQMKLLTMFSSDQVFTLQRDIVEEGIDVSHRSYALIGSDVWVQALKSYNELREIKEKNLLIDGSIDVYSFALRVSVISETSTLTLKIRKKDNKDEIHKKACKIFCSDSDPVRIWDFSGQTNLILMNEWSRISESNNQPELDFVLHVHVLEPITKPEPKKDESNSTQINRTNGFFYENSPNQNQNQNQNEDLMNGSFKSIGSGLVGLENLGNTCFMNSALQCLVHTNKLVKYFLDDFAKDINLSNPLGTKGELALAFGDLLRRLWSLDKAPVAPHHLKSKISRFAPQFRGYNQHDSQELLAFLLDGLHEDLNRVKKKPYFEYKDSDERPDAEVADDHWLNHLARNNSVIVDFCQGQYKSTLVCPTCNNVSITFDPFMYLSLPIPSLSTRSITVSVFGTNGTAQYTITVPKSGDLNGFVQSLSLACDLREDETLVLASVYNGRIIGYLEDLSGSISIIRDGDRIIAYRLQKDKNSSPILVFVHQKLETIIGKVTRWKQFGVPLITRVPQTLTSTTIRTEYLNSMNPFLLPDQSETATCPPNSEEDDPLQFFLTDERGQSQTKIENEEPVKIGITQKRVYVLVSWYEKSLDRYDVGPMNNLPEVYKSSGLFTRRPLESISLYSCLEAFLKEEPLGPHDMWYCPKCKEHGQASKKLDLWRLPEVLIIHLKRFSYSRYIKHKLDTSIDFPIHDLYLSKYLSRPDSNGGLQYRLYAISNHYGGMGGGHYTAHAYNEGEKKWYNFDDRRVSAVSEENIKSSAAYVLFYKRI